MNWVRLRMVEQRLKSFSWLKREQQGFVAAAAAFGICKKLNVTRDIQPLRKKQDITISNLRELLVPSGHIVMNANYIMILSKSSKGSNKKLSYGIICRNHQLKGNRNSSSGFLNTVYGWQLTLSGRRLWFPSIATRIAPTFCKLCPILYISFLRASI